MLAILNRFSWLSDLNKEELFALQASQGQAIMLYTYRFVLLSRRQQLDEMLGLRDKLELDCYKKFKDMEFAGAPCNLDNVATVSYSFQTMESFKL